MNNLHADPLQDDVATDEAKTGSSFGDLSTVGPAVTTTLVAGQKVLVTVSCEYLVAADGTTAFMSFAVSGASNLAATDPNGARIFSIKTGTNTGGAAFRQSLYTATNTGSHTFTAKYRSNGTDNMHFINRRIIIKKY